MAKTCSKHSHLALESLEKGAIKNAALAIGTAATLAGSPAKAPAPKISQQTQEQKTPQNKYDHKRMLRSIASVESSNGKNTNHKEVKHGLNAGTHAYGMYGLTGNTIKDTIKMHPDLKQKHSKAIALGDKELSNYMHDNKGLEDTIADRHLTRLEQHFGQDPDKIGYSWLNGINGTQKAVANGENIGNHWHVKKIKEAYGKTK